MLKRLSTCAIAFAFVSSAILAGCANMPSGEPSVALGDANNGVVAATITFLNGTHTMDAWVYIRKKGETDKDKYVRLSAIEPFSRRSMVAFSPLLTSIAQPDFADTTNRSGRALAVPLSPGEYEIYSWRLYIRTFGGYGYVSPRTEEKPLPLVVTAGRITHLGSLHAETLMGHNLVGIDVPAGGIIHISDASERDISFVKEKFPTLNDWPIDKANLDPKSWLH
jgi:hypothetical protein